MYFTPIILTSFQPYFYNYPPQTFQIPQPPRIDLKTEDQGTLTHAAQKFKEFITTSILRSSLSLSTHYMNLNQKYSSIELPEKEQFISLYNSAINRYKTTYGNQKIKHSWSRQDVIIVLWIINWFYHKKMISPQNFSKQDWEIIASMVPFRTGEDCMFKWLSMRNNQLEEFPWTNQEKTQLAFIMQSNTEIQWNEVSKKLFEKHPQNFRTPKQCKQSWSIIQSSRFQRSKKFWSYEQDTLLFQAFYKFGRRWKQMASLIQGRSENAIKNRFTLLCQKYCGKEITSKNDIDLIQFVQVKLLEEATQQTTNLSVSN